MTTLIWQGDVLHDVHVISPAKFYKGSVIPIDCFFDFWNIAIATNQEILDATKRKDAMEEQGRLKIIDGDKEEVAWGGDQIDLYTETYEGLRGEARNYWDEPYEKEVESLGFAIVHGYMIDQAHFTLEIEGKFDEKKLTFDRNISQVLYDGKEFTLIPEKEWKTFSYGEETERTRRVEGELTHGRHATYLFQNQKGQEQFHSRYVHAYKKKKNVDWMSPVKMDGFMSWYCSKTDAEILPNYGYEETILPENKKYKEVCREDTSFPKYFHERLWYNHESGETEMKLFNPLNPELHGVHVGKRKGI